jgi:hypothetical protein
MPALRATVRPVGTFGTQLSARRSGSGDGDTAGMPARGSQLSDGGSGTGALAARDAAGPARLGVRRGSDAGIATRSTSRTVGNAVPHRRHAAQSNST